MLKRLASKYWPMVLLLILTGAVLCMSRYAESHKADSQQGSPGIPASPNDASKSAENAEKAKHPPNWIETFTWPEGVTTWALLLTLFVIAWQSTETRAAAQATQASADGVEKQSLLMKRQADAMEAQNKIAQDRERARLVIRGPDIPEIFPPHNLLPDLLTIVIRIFIANEGATKAFNTKAYGMLRIVDSLDGAPYLPGYQQSIPSTIDSTRGEDFIKVTVTGMGSSTNDWVAINQATANNIIGGIEFLQISGVVIYDDLLERIMKRRSASSGGPMAVTSEESGWINPIGFRSYDR
jgi:hypothetical protein